jgi:hypothetical protein
MIHAGFTQGAPEFLKPALTHHFQFDQRLLDRLRESRCTQFIPSLSRLPFAIPCGNADSFVMSRRELVGALVNKWPENTPLTELHDAERPRIARASM